MDGNSHVFGCSCAPVLESKMVCNIDERDVFGGACFADGFKSVASDRYHSYDDYRNVNVRICISMVADPYEFILGKENSSGRGILGIFIYVNAYGNAFWAYHIRNEKKKHGNEDSGANKRIVCAHLRLWRICFYTARDSFLSFFADRVLSVGNRTECLDFSFTEYLHNDYCWCDLQYFV